MKDRGEQLIDLAIRESLRGEYVSPAISGRLAAARKFTLDKAMSAYLADLTMAAWASPRAMKSNKYCLKLIDGVRKLARLPHELTWIEYDCHAKVQHSREAYPSYYDPEELKKPIYEKRHGFLLERHPKVESAARLYSFFHFQTSKIPGRTEMKPVNWCWVSDDDVPMPFAIEQVSIDDLRTIAKQNFCSISSIATGVSNYHSDKVGIQVTARSGRAWARQDVIRSLREEATVLRTVWALLATINDLPTSTSLIRPSKGYVARGRYRHFCEHSIVHLHVPEHRSLRTMAMRAVALIRRRAHMVRGHWRKDFRKPGIALCDHDYQASNNAVACKHCGRARIWIKDHERGDSALGFVLHDYSIEHAPI